MKNVFRSLSLATLVAIVAACSSTPIDQKPPIETKSGNEVGTDTRAVPTVQPTSNMDPLDDPKGKLAERSIYFDLDEYSIKPEYRELIQAHARYLTANPNRNIVIQGNTDERGGAEYNLALGQRRADAVKTLMKALGVSEMQIETVSFGKEKPKAFGSNEAAWAENRRADIVYK